MWNKARCDGRDRKRAEPTTRRTTHAVYKGVCLLLATSGCPGGDGERGTVHTLGNGTMYRVVWNNNIHEKIEESSDALAFSQSNPPPPPPNPQAKTYLRQWAQRQRGTRLRSRKRKRRERRVSLLKCVRGVLESMDCVVVWRGKVIEIAEKESIELHVVRGSRAHARSSSSKPKVARNRVHKERELEGGRRRSHIHNTCSLPPQRTQDALRSCLPLCVAAQRR